MLSNHGGRQLDTAKSGLELLVEVVPELKKRGLWPNPNFHIFVDGGIRRASDALKALALGASAVGIGKGFLYSYCAYGQDGVEHAIKILKEEMEMNMRMLGITKLDEVTPEMVDARALTTHTVPSPENVLVNNTCKYNYKCRTASLTDFCQTNGFNWLNSAEQSCDALHRLFASFMTSLCIRCGLQILSFVA